MTVAEALRRADGLRPNALETAQKESWLRELEGRLYPREAGAGWTGQLLRTAPPYDSVYERYLCAMIDLAQQDLALYTADAALFQEVYDAYAAARMRAGVDGVLPRRKRRWQVL